MSELEHNLKTSMQKTVELKEYFYGSCGNCGKVFIEMEERIKAVENENDKQKEELQHLKQEHEQWQIRENIIPKIKARIEIDEVLGLKK